MRGELAREKAAADAELKKIRDEAQGERARILAGVEEEAAALRAEVEREVKERRDEAVKRAREVVSNARMAASEVLEEGTELGQNLGQLANSMRSNAERILRDTQQAHRALIARLDAVANPALEDDRRGRDEIRASRRTPRSASLTRDEDLGVPDFISLANVSEQDFDIPEFLA